MVINSLGVIPARYASTRFPGKPLVMIEGMTMIERVYRQAKKSSLVEVMVATDDERIYSHVVGFGGRVMMTSGNHQSGTERIGEVVQKLERDTNAHAFDIVVNIQGDEPYINPSQIDLAISCFEDPEVEISTLVMKIRRKEDLSNPNVVKAVVSISGDALYFSRSAIPYFRGRSEDEWVIHHIYYKHIGLYAFRLGALKRIMSMPVGFLEKAESLEQLRWLENNLKIRTVVSDVETIAIDTPEDLRKLINNT